MKEQSHFSRKALAAWCLMLIILTQQVVTSPVPEMEEGSGLTGNGLRSLRRVARMTPLWRGFGTKPHGAYCMNNYECSTRICRKGHCSFSQSKKS